MTGSVALDILLVWAGFKVLKAVAKKVIGAIATRIEQPADKLKEVTQSILTTVIDETGVGSDTTFNVTKLKIDIDKKIDSGEIKTFGGVNKELERYLKANESPKT
jgi:hypothetical protein